MTATSTTTRRSAAAVTATAVALGTGLVLAPTATAAPPPPGSTVELAPGVDNVWPTAIGGEGIYFGGRPADVWAGGVFVRDIEARGPGGSTIGEATLVGRTIADGLMAEHEGTLAYTRAVDERLVLRAPDGTETLPEWGDHGALAGGVLDLTDAWLVGADNPYEPARTLFDRSSGETYDLAELVDIPDEIENGDSPIWGLHGLVLTDDHALFGVYASAVVGGTERQFTGVYLVALGASGPEGPVTTLAEVTEDLDAVPSTSYAPVGIDGDDIVWERLTCDGTACTTDLLWYGAAPYEGTPSELALDDRSVVRFEGGTVVTTRPTGDTGETVDWIDIAVGATPTLSVDIEGSLIAEYDGLFTWFDEAASRTMLTDAYGLVTADQTGVTGLWPFSDLVADGAFTDETLWLYDRGIVAGHPDGTFRNLSSVTREAMAAFLYRTVHQGVTAPTCEEAPFDDVATSHPFCGEIAWLATFGISTGWPDGTFRPGQPVTREAMAAFLYRLAHLSGGDAPACTEAPFADVTTGHPFCGEIAWLADAGVSTGWPDDTFRPGLTIERQAMAAFLFRFIDGGHAPGAL